MTAPDATHPQIRSVAADTQIRPVVAADGRTVERGDTIEAEYRYRNGARVGRRTVRVTLTHVWPLRDGLVYVSDGEARYAVLADSIRLVPARPAGADEPAPAAAAAGLVHWFAAGGPLGDPAVCHSPEGRATRIASAVTCPACVAWMSDEAWTGHSGTGAA
jgi:hypothetical protein